MEIETKLLITEITRMGPGFCVIGLEYDGASFRSIRPLPPVGHAWRSFPYTRGDILRFHLSFIPVLDPHREDRYSSGILGCAGHISNEEMRGYLRKAEVADHLTLLFGSTLLERNHRGNVCVDQGQGNRSICGCEFSNLQFQLFGEEVRVSLTLLSGETLRYLPLVDRDWNQFIESAFRRLDGPNRLQRVARLLRWCRVHKILLDPHPFARIGLSRPFDGACWFMLDTLFPLPQDAWLDELN